MLSPGAPAIVSTNRQALRLVFWFDGDDVRLVSRERVQMTLSTSEGADQGENQAGFWAETRAADGRVLDRRFMHNPMRGDVEVFSDDATTSISRRGTERRSGAFTVV